MSKAKFVAVLALTILLATATILLPSFSLGFTSLYNEKRIVQGIILFIGAILFFSLLIEYRLNISRKSVTLFLLLALFWLTSIIYSNLPQWALFEIGWYLCLLQLSLVLGYIYQKYPAYFERIFLLAIVGFVTIYSVRVIGDITTTFFREDWPIWPNRSSISVVMGGVELIPQGFLGFQNFRYFNHVQTWTLPILAYAYIFFSTKPEKYLKNLIGALLPIWFMIAIASGARGTLIAVIVSLIFTSIIFKKKNYKRWISVCLITLGIGLILYLFVFHLLIPLGAERSFGSGKPFVRYDSSSRFDLWMVTLKTIIENPLLGVGPMHLANVKGSNPITSSHNIYLMWIAEWGLPAFSVFAYIVYDNFKKWVKQAIDRPSVKKIAITGTFFAGIIHSGASGLLITPLSQLIFAALIGWIIGIYYSEQNEAVFTKGITRFKYAFISIILIINLFTFYRLVAEIPYLERNSEKFQTLYRNNQLKIFPTVNATMFPRFWKQGFIGVENVDNNY